MRRNGFQQRMAAGCGMLLAATLLAAGANKPAPPDQEPPPMPRYPHLSPVEKFRGLLGMSPAERERELAHRSPDARKIILAKLREYEALPRGVREARLCQTELHWELSNLMRLPRAARSNELEDVSFLYRPMVEDLLRQWDSVPAGQQKALLEKQDFIGLYVRMQGSSPAAQEELLKTLLPERRAQWASEMQHWQALPANERSQLCAQFQRFFSLSAPEQAETVGALPDGQRQQMTTAINAFNILPADQRQHCIRSFGKFAAMNADERAQFIKNAARWKAMTPKERQLWRQMVTVLPPVPPGFAADLPPEPPGFHESARGLPPLPPDVTTPVVIARSVRP